jgi:hypothetical protein
VYEAVIVAAAETPVRATTLESTVKVAITDIAARIFDLRMSCSPEKGWVPGFMGPVGCISASDPGSHANPTKSRPALLQHLTHIVDPPMSHLECLLWCTTHRRRTG